MNFCPKCGSILMPGKGGVVCPRCNYKSSEKVDVAVKESVKEGIPLDIIEDEGSAYPIVDAKCPKCGHNKARFWEIQTRASDEPATQFFKCIKCKHTWRNYD